MYAAIKKAAPFAAIAVAAILAGCAVAPAPYHDDVYAYSGPSTVFVGPCCYDGGTYDHFHRYDGYGHHWNGGGRMHGGHR